jgi:glycosyltransferase involved in cell wall biosynthesis
LEKTLLSTIAQTYSNKEIVIIDGGSKDGTLKVIEKYKPFISIVVSEPDNGIYDAMNKGVKCSSGEWINFMNAGDEFSDNEVISNISIFLSENLDVVYGNTNTIYSDTAHFVCAKPVSYMKKNMPFCHQSSFTRRSRLLQYPFDQKYRYVADYNFFFTLYQNKGTFLRSNITISNYEAEYGVSALNRKKVFKEIMEVNRNHSNIIFRCILYIKLYRFLLMEETKKLSPKLVRKIRDMHFFK